MEEQRKNFRISPPIPLPPGVEGPKRFVKNKAESNGLRGELQKCSNLDSVVLAVLIGTPGSFAVFQSLLEKSGFTVTEIDALPSSSFLHEYVGGGGPLVNIIPSPPEVRGRGSSGDPAAATAPPEVREARRSEAAARVDADVARRAQHAQSTELDRMSSVSDALSKSEGELRVELAATKAELERSDERATKLAAEVVAAERRRHDEMAAERRRQDEMAAERRRQDEMASIILAQKDEMASIFLEMLRRSEVREQEAREREARRCCCSIV
jgi:hypothetical protein